VPEGSLARDERSNVEEGERASCGMISTGIPQALGENLERDPLPLAPFDMWQASDPSVDPAARLPMPPQ
jgi:hypothetical protein